MIVNISELGSNAPHSHALTRSLVLPPSSGGQLHLGSAMRWQALV